jgi:hypothetical protein
MDLPLPRPASEVAMSLITSDASSKTILSVPAEAVTRNNDPTSEPSGAVLTINPRMDPLQTDSAPIPPANVIPMIRIPAPAPARDPRVEAARLAEMVRLEQEARNLVDNLEKDPRLEVTRLAPEQLKSARMLSARVTQELQPRTAAALQTARNTMLLLQQEATHAMEVAARGKAAQSVAEISAIHQRLRTRWAPFVRRGSLASDMAAADKGFAALQEDFKAGRYVPIAEKSDGFRLVLERIEQAAARNWIESMLMTGGVRRSLKEGDINQISLLQAQGKHVEAANLLESKAGGATVNVREATAARAMSDTTGTSRKMGSRSSSARSASNRNSTRNSRRIVIEDTRPRR